MHADRSIDQKMSYSSMMDIIPIYKKIPDVWKRSIGVNSTKDSASMPDWFRALWNCPYQDQFVHRHPWITAACDMDGVPILDSDGNLQLLFDPDYTNRYNRHFRKVESVDEFRVLDFSVILGDQGGEEV